MVVHRRGSHYLNTILYKNSTHINFYPPRKTQYLLVANIKQYCFYLLSLLLKLSQGLRLKYGNIFHNYLWFLKPPLFFAGIFQHDYIKYIQMTQNDEKTQHRQAQLCPKCKEMYGHVNYDFLCSICYKKQKNLTDVIVKPRPNSDLKSEADLPQLQSQAEPSSLKRPLQKVDEKEELPKGKCTKCSKKTGMLGFACKHCSLEFCKFHRLPQDHNCGVDFVTLGRKKIKTENPVILSKKIEDI